MSKAFKTPRKGGPAGGKPVIDPAILPSGLRIGYVHFWTDDPKHECVVSLGADQPASTPRISQYDFKARPLRRALPVYVGETGYKVTLSLMFDAPRGDFVNSDIFELEAMAIKDRSDRASAPIVHWDSSGTIAHDYTEEPHVRWIITDMAPGSAEWRDDGRKKRLNYLITLEEWVADEHLKAPTKRKGAKHRKYRVRKGDTLKSIAKHIYHDTSKWREIAKLNGIRDGNNLGKLVGKEIKLP